MIKIRSKSQFIEKALIIHGDKYDYSDVLYMGSKSKVSIICKTHGVFYQSINNHLCGKGCPHCVRKDTVIDFINKSRLVHGLLYDYSYVNYKNKETRVEIICQKHGSFFLLPKSHYNGSGCPYCSRKYIDIPFKANKTKKRSKDEWKHNKELLRLEKQANFISKARIIHGDTYNYSKVFYSACNNPVEIICNKHGSFFQITNTHLRGSGCSKCTKGNNFKKVDWVSFVKDKICTLYLVLIYDEKELFLKVGITSKQKIYERLHQCTKFYKYKVIMDIKGSAEFTFLQEKIIQKEFNNYQYMPMKKFGGHTECFKVNMINEITERFLKIKSEHENIINFRC